MIISNFHNVVNTNVVNSDTLMALHFIWISNRQIDKAPVLLTRDFKDCMPHWRPKRLDGPYKVWNESL